MTERNPSLWLQNRTDHTAENDRSLLVSAFGGREGVSGANDMKVSQRGAGANMSVDVAIGRALVLGDDSALTQGTYHVWNDAVKNLTIAASDPTNPRKDIVVARVRDAFYSGATNAWALEVIAGTPAASPAEPALPNNALKLAVVTVPAAASSIVDANIADSRIRAAALGGIVVAQSASLLPSPTAGLFAYRADEDRPYYGNGTDWAPNGAGGMLEGGYAQRTSDVPAIGTGGLDLTGLSVTVTVATGRRLKITGHARSWLLDTADNRIAFRIQEGATVLNENILRLSVANEAEEGGDVTAVIAPSAGSHTYKLTAGVIDSGTATMNAGATYPAFILVEDIGPA